ncbi:AAA family ATPase [Zavarzinella formosa]|uniref:AAA family ATPase n=1 Tax=Zavarzinella formosa TaxID=360055 RepID=UPI0002EED7A4|nr:AAA family ATPase [Zavarzinella formosa]
MHRIAIVDPNEASRESLRTMLLGVDFVWLEAECARYEYFFDVVQQSTPDLAIVALDGDKPKALAMIGQLGAEYPKLSIITISSDSTVLLQSLQLGAKHFLTDPPSLEAMVTTLRKALHEVPGTAERPGLPNAQKANGQIISVLGSRGGIGCTSIAVNLAAALASWPENNVALIDLDLAMGDADIAVELPGNDNISMGDLARNIERLDMNYLRRALVKHPDTGLSILRHPLELHEISGIHEGHIERILNLVKMSYTHLIADLSKGLLPTDLMSLRMSSTILLVCQLELSSLRNVVRLIHSLSMEGDLGDRIRVVVNRTGSEHMEDGITVKKAEEVIGKPIFWQIPNDSKAMIGSRVAGMPLIKHSPKSRAHQSVLGLAQALTGRTPVAEAAKKRGWFGS